MTAKTFVFPGAAYDGDGTWGGAAEKTGARGARNSPASVAQGPDIELCFRRATTCTNALTLLANGEPSAPMTVSAYALDDGTDIPDWPKPRIWPSDPKESGAVHLHERSSICLRDLDLKTLGICIYGFMQGPDAGRFISVQRVDTHDSGSGMALYSLALNSASVRGLLVEDSTFLRHAGHGSAVYGSVNGAAFMRSAWLGNGITSASHGATSFAHRIAFTGTAGWKPVGGDVFVRDLGGVTDIKGVPQRVYRCVSNAFGALTFNESGTPGSNEYSFASGLLLVNVGPGGPQVGFTIMAFVEQAQGIVYTQCEFASTHAFGGSEGAGVQFDDGSSGTLTDCISHDNEGCGAVANWGERHVVNGLITYGNGTYGFLGASANDMALARVSTLNNGTAGINVAGSRNARIRGNSHMGEKVGVIRDVTTAMADSSYANCAVQSAVGNT